MKVVFCTDDRPRYLTLLKVAVRSLRHVMGEDIPCLCIYAGDRADTLRLLENERLPVARYAPRLDFSGAGKHVRESRGCFLKLELALVPELAEEDYVLYCDTDVMFLRPLDELFALRPPYMAMVRECTAPFYHEHASLSYELGGHTYTVPMPFPIWTFSSGVTLFNLARLRRMRLIDHFLAFSQQNLDRIGNLDQSLLNYYFGKRITRLEERWNRPPYYADCHATAHIVHFHGPKPWEGKDRYWQQNEHLAINDFEPMSRLWKTWLRPEEQSDANYRYQTPADAPSS